MEMETMIDNWTTANDGILGAVIVNDHEIVADWATCTVYVDGAAFLFISGAARNQMRAMFDEASGWAECY